MASEFTIDIQLTELGFQHIPEFNEELPLKETSQINSSCSPPDIPASSKSPPVTNVPVDQRVLQLVQNNVCSLPNALPVATSTSPLQSTYSLEINQPQASQHLTLIKSDRFSDMDITTTPAATTKETVAVEEKKGDCKTVTSKTTAFVDVHEIVKESNAEKVVTQNDEQNTLAHGSNINQESNAEKTATPNINQESSAEETAPPEKAVTQNDGRISLNVSNISQENTAYDYSDDSEVSEQDEEEEEDEEEGTDDDAQFLAPDAAGEHRCSVCHQAFTNGFLLREHMHVHTGVRPYLCAECGKQFCHLANYRAHLRSHAQSVPIRCCVCQASFETEQRLQLHLQNTHFENEFYQCDFCKRIFTRLEDCEIHVHNHKSEASLPQCPNCGRRFKQEKSLRRHLHKRCCQRSYVCDDCGQSFRKKNALLRHSFTHLGLLPYTCTHCKTHFRLARLYRRHNCKPEAIQCVACLSKFTSHRDFKEHKKATGCWGSLQQQPQNREEIRCMECGQTFGTAEELKKHAGSHQRVLKCAECGMGFRSAFMLMSHMGGHMGQRPCLCQQCGLGFPHQQGYNLHLKDCGATPPAKVTTKKTQAAQSNSAKKSRTTTKKQLAPAPPEKRAKKANTAKVPETRQPDPKAPEKPAESGWKLSLDTAPPPNTPLVVLLPVSAGVPAGLTVSGPEPQNLSLKKQNGVAASVQPPQTQDGNANTVLNLEQNATALDSFDTPQTLQCEHQQLHTLPQLCLDPSVKTELENTGFTQTCTSSGFGNTSDASGTVQVKKEESGEEPDEFSFREEKVNVLPLKAEIKIQEEFTALDLKTEVELKDVILQNVTKETDAFDGISDGEEKSDLLITDIRSEGAENPEQSNLVISDVRSGAGESLERSDWLITDVRSESSVSECSTSRKEQMQKCEKETCSQVSNHHEVPLDLRLNVNSNECPTTRSQEKTVSHVLEETAPPGHHRGLEANKLGDNSSFTTVVVDLGDDQRGEQGEVEGEPHECVTCGRIILEGDLVQHYMEHAVQDGHHLDKRPSQSRASSPSSSWCSSSYSAPSSECSSPSSTPPASPPSKRLRSRAK